MVDITSFRQLEGLHVCLALRAGRRIDDCLLVGVPRGAAQTVWVFDSGVDVFVPLVEVLDVWEAGHPHAA